MALVRSLVSALVEDQVRSLVGTGFSPLSLFSNGEQGAWYDPSDLSTLYQDSAGTTPVTADGDPVGLMLDKSGNGNHASQAVAADRPVYRTDGTLHWLQFNGVNSYLSTSVIDFTQSDKASIFAAVELGSLGATDLFLEFSTNVNDNPGSFFVSSPNSSFDNYGSLSRGTASSSAGQNALSGQYATPDRAVLSIGHDISGDLSTIRRNGVSGVNGTGDKGAGNFGAYKLYIGARSGPSLAFSGKSYGIVVRSSLTASAKTENTENYLAQKAGVTLNG